MVGRTHPTRDTAAVAILTSTVKTTLHTQLLIAVLPSDSTGRDDMSHWPMKNVGVEAVVTRSHLCRDRGPGPSHSSLELARHSC